MNKQSNLRYLIVDAPGSLGERARARRWQMFTDWFPDISEMSVIDLGGTTEFWLRAPVQPAHVHLLNLLPPNSDIPGWIRTDVADVCDPPSSVLRGTYDVVFSNSVVEHVGGHERRQRFTEVVGQLAPSFWIQTPYRYFPLEPHWLIPGLQFFPVGVRAHIALKWPLVAARPSGFRGALADQLGVELLDVTQMRFYFPQGSIVKERVLGLVKSIVAVKGPEAD